jgi:nondiscriminating glutamyl-tRNA synthetase
MADVRVRFAPSPTGYLHMGGARTALFNWLFARHHRGRLILRIEDTDRSRSSAELAEGLCATLRWLGLDWDEGPFRQTDRLSLYRRAADRLEAEGRAYRCYCTPEDLAARRDAARARGEAPRYDGRCRDLGPGERRRLEAEGRRPALRLRVDPRGQTVVEDRVFGPVRFANEELDDFVILKSDGLPTYNFAVVVDDADMGITHVIRGDEHLSNTPKQIQVYGALGIDPPIFAHIPLILAPDRSKLSKRHGAVAVEELRDQGYLPEALVNYCALLGWSPGDEREVFTRDELVERFDLDRVNRSAAVYDFEKLAWMNAQWLRRLQPEELVERAAPWLRGRRIQPAWAAAVRERVHTLAELAQAVEYFLVPPSDYDEAGRRKHFGPQTAARLRAAREALAAVEPWDEPACEAAYRSLAERLGCKAAELIHPTRLALTGRTVGPSLFLIVALLGRAETLSRLDAAIRFLDRDCAV